jgi:uncharacterized protein (DUF2141 family)
MRIVSWLVLSAALAPISAASQTPSTLTATLQVTVTGVRAQQGGVLVVALYDAEARWLTLDSARAIRRLAPTADSLVAVFEDLPLDSSYAIAVIHDKNGNDKLDMRWFPFPKPKEGAGVSQNHLRMGKPRYDQARFALLSTFEYQRIKMRY